MSAKQLALTALASLAIGSISTIYWNQSMKTEKSFITKEPLLIEAESNSYYSILPAGTALYHDKSWPEGHSTYHVYFHVKSDFASEPNTSDMLQPLWLRTVEKSELLKLVSEYLLTTEDLRKIIKARGITREEYIQILRDWEEPEKK